MGSPITRSNYHLPRLRDQQGASALQIHFVTQSEHTVQEKFATPSLGNLHPKE